MMMNFHNYIWIQTTILVKWEILLNSTASSKIEVLFINLPEKQQEYIWTNFPRADKERLYPFAWHALFAKSLIGLYDEGIWVARDLVRPFEKVRYFLCIKNQTRATTL
jgi:hypothetical protein